MSLVSTLSEYTPSALWASLKELQAKGVDWNDIRDKRTIATFCVGFGAAYLLYKQVTKKRYNLPPGPYPLPLIGNFHNIGFTDFSTQLVKLQEKYGPIFKLYLGPMMAIVVSDHALMKEAFLTKGDVFSDRPQSFTTDLFSGNGKDIAFGQYGPELRAQRKIAHAALRKYAGGDKIEALVKASSEKVFEVLDEIDGPVNLQDHLMMFIYNVFAAICFGKTYTLDDPFLVFMKETNEYMTQQSDMAMILDFVPLLQKDFMGIKFVKKLKEFARTIEEYVEKEYDEHYRTYDPDSLTDLMYDIIHLGKEAERQSNQGQEQAKLSKTHYLWTVLDVFGAGTDTTRHTLAFIIQHCIKYPEVQKKIQEEIEDVVGSDPSVPLTIKSREQLHYMQAVIYEVLRTHPAGPQTVPHLCTQDATIGGYDIPKGTMIIGSIYGIHMDPKAYPDPEEFRPERWLDKDGKFNSQGGPWVPFSLGKRVCVGESLAKVEISLTLAMFLRKYTFEAVPGEEVNTKPIDILGGFFPQPFKVIMKKRY